MGPEHYIVRTMARDEVHIALDWAAAEGWNPGLRDGDAFYAADRGAFLVGTVGGEPVAVISAARYGGTFGFLGFFIVRPDCRGMGYGTRIWDAALARLEGRNMGLDAVVAQEGNYVKSGFTRAHRNIRFEGVSGGRPAEDPAVVDLLSVPFEAVEAYDRPFFPDERSAFLKAWLNHPGGVALGIMRDGRLSGYGVVRPCRTGYKVGPLFADSPKLADTLFRHLSARVEPGMPIYLDAPEKNPDAVALAGGRSMKRTFETARMYKGVHPVLPMDRLFGITSFEFG